VPDRDHPTRARWTILALLFLITIVTYIDRVNISVTARQMMPALGLTDLEMGEVFSAFVLGYALFQVPGGWLGDRWGPRLVLALAVLWWSVFTALTAVAATLPLAGWLGVGGSLAAIRFLVGAGEAAALPNMNRTVADWFAPDERGLGMGVTIAGLGVGSALTPPVTAWIMVNFGWQTAFYAGAALGLAAAGAWFWYARDRPSDHPRVNAAELAVIRAAASEVRTAPGPVPWRRIARTPAVWLLVLSYTCLGYVAYLYLSWFYLYLVNVRGFGMLRGAFLAAAPFLAITLFCPVGGWATDRLSVRLGINRGRAWVGAAGMACSGLSIVVGAWLDAPYWAIAWLAIGAGWLYFTVGAYWSSTVDLSKPHAGTLSGLMNTGANIGGTLSPTLTPWLAEQFGWPAALGAAAALALLGALLWLPVRPGDGLAEDPARPARAEDGGPAPRLR
jgi:ACS family glucarate transporter-like MFS transporter